MPTDSPLDRIREVAPSLPPALALVADWLLRHAVQAATLGIEDIAKAAGTSAASVNRLARQAGYDGFIALKADLARELQAAIGPVLDTTALQRRPREVHTRCQRDLSAQPAEATEPLGRIVELVPHIDHSTPADPPST